MNGSRNPSTTQTPEVNSPARRPDDNWSLIVRTDRPVRWDASYTEMQTWSNVLLTFMLYFSPLWTS